MRQHVIEALVGFGRECAPVRCAHPSFWAHCHAKQGAAPPPPRPTQIRCFSFDPKKYIKFIDLGPPMSKAFFFPLDHMQTAEAMKYEVPCPAHRSFADPSGNILGSKLCTSATKRPNIFRFFLFYIVFLDLLFLLFFFFFFSPFYFLLIHLFLSFSAYLSLFFSYRYYSYLLILLFLYFKLFVVLQTWYIRHSEGFFEGAKPFLIH